MNAKQRRTLEAVFTEPARANIAWSDIETLIVAAGARRIEVRGSRVRFEYRGMIAAFTGLTRPRRQSATRCGMPASFLRRSELCHDECAGIQGFQGSC